MVRCLTFRGVGGYRVQLQSALPPSTPGKHPLYCEILSYKCSLGSESRLSFGSPALASTYLCSGVFSTIFFIVALYLLEMQLQSALPPSTPGLNSVHFGLVPLA